MVPRVVPLTHVVHRVASALGAKGKAAQPIEIFRDIAREVPAFGGLHYGALGHAGARGEARALAGVGA
jgi:predicted molibdopterin-dependent oxidoreductase YjgC